MAWSEIHSRLLTSLQAELRGNWGRISEVEERLSCSPGYLTKLCSGANPFKLDLFLQAVEALELDPKAFLARTLEIQTTPADYLRQLEEPDSQDRPFAAISQATRELVASEPSASLAEGQPTQRRKASNAVALATKMMDCSRKEQARRLRHTPKYRTQSFANAYLEQLVSLRYSDPVGAARLVTVLITDLIPKLPAPQRGRLSLQCRALGLFATSRRVKGEFSTAAKAFRLALELSRQTRLDEDTAYLLRLASYLLKDFAHFERALEFLREALEIYVDLDSRPGIAKTLIDRGMMFCLSGDYDSAARVLQRAMSHLEFGTPEPRYLFAAYQYLSYAFEQLGDLEAAESSLETATSIAGLEKGFYCGKLQWMQGTLAFKRGDYARSEALLRSACEVLSAQENPAQEALVSIDLVETLLAQAKAAEACSLAKDMTRLLECFPKNKLAEMAIVQLIRAALQGELTRELLGEVRVKLDGKSALEQSASKPA
ncbi:MAG: hypothetical protein AAF657_32565 [Acidobacteriota bacterium]